MAWGVLLVLLTACGRIGFDPQPTMPRDGDASSADAGVPQPVAELDTTFDEDDISLTGDMLEIYFDSNRSGAIKIWRATRMATTAPWDPPAMVTELDGATGSDATPTVSADGLTIYFSSTRGGNQDFYVSERLLRTDMWSAPVRDAALSSSTVDFRAALSQDRLRVYFASTRVGAQLDIYTSARATAGATWPTPTAIPELATGAAEADPWLSADELAIVFSSNREHPMRDIYMATRTTTADPFGAPVPMSECNTVDYADDGPWLSPDLKTMFFSSNRSGTADIYMISR